MSSQQSTCLPPSSMAMEKESVHEQSTVGNKSLFTGRVVEGDPSCNIIIVVANCCRLPLCSRHLHTGMLLLKDLSRYILSCGASLIRKQATQWSSLTNHRCLVCESFFNI